MPAWYNNNVWRMFNNGSCSTFLKTTEAHVQLQEVGYIPNASRISFSARHMPSNDMKYVWIVPTFILSLFSHFVFGFRTLILRRQGHGSSRLYLLTFTRPSERTVPYSTTRLEFVSGPDPSTKPDYESIHGPLGKHLDQILLSMFRSSLAKNIGVDSSRPKQDYAGILDLVTAMNARFSNREEIQKIAQDTLRDLFPGWLPGQYAILFSKPFPRFSARMNAWATRMGGTWLMGECVVNDVEINGEIYKDQGLLVKRCRFLEESGCASVCVNACKIPTQNFFIHDMGLPLTMTPDYETYECQFSFGVSPDQKGELEAKNTPCLSRCPTAGRLQTWHNGGAAPTIGKVDDVSEITEVCQFMEEL